VLEKLALARCVSGIGDGVARPIAHHAVMQLIDHVAAGFLEQKRQDRMDCTSQGRQEQLQRKTGCRAEMLTIGFADGGWMCGEKASDHLRAPLDTENSLIKNPRKHFPIFLYFYCLYRIFFPSCFII
jgi:hypothetical protein